MSWPLELDNDGARVLMLVESDSTSTVSLAAYYIYAAWVGNRGMMKLSIVGRAAATAIFWTAGGALRGVSAFEAAMGAITGLALWAKPEQGSLSRSV